MRTGVIQLGLLAAAMLMGGNQSADAVVYCKYVGVPKGCVAKPGVVLRPAPVVYCQYINYPVGCVARPGVVLAPRPAAVGVATPGVGAPGVGVRAGTPANRGGPVNRAGRR
jgi:hypothetical protein